MVKMLVTVLVAAAGGLLFYKLKVPAGALIGSMLAVAIYNVLSNSAFIPTEARVGIQVLAGGIIGMRVNREALSTLKTMVVPALIIVISVLLINLALGFLLYKLTRLDLATCLFGSAPGGVVEMTLAAEALGADTPKVALMQLLRLFSVLSFMPFILKTAVQYLRPGG